MDLTTLVAGPGLGEVHPKLVPPGGDVLLPDGDEWAKHLDSHVGALPDRLGHGCHELLPAVRVDGVIPRMGGDDQPLGLAALGESGGDGEHNAVSERDHGGFHGRLLVVPIRNLATGLEEVGGKEIVHKVQSDSLMGNTKQPSMVPGEGNLAVVVLRAVVETDGPHDLVFPGSMVESYDRVHSSADKHHNFHASELG